jgi:phage N-6-adenine-methyltransferase
MMNNTAKVSSLGYIGKVPSTTARDSDSWNTPEAYWTAAERVLGGFGLDPFTNGQSRIPADRQFTIDDDALTTPWSGNERGSVWMNPPYGRGILDDAVNRFMDQYEEGAFDRGIVLVNNSTETKAFKRMLASCRLTCFTGHRIAFESPDGKRISGNTRAQVFFLFDRNKRRTKYDKAFTKEFNKFGNILKVVL